MRDKGRKSRDPLFICTYRICSKYTACSEENFALATHFSLDTDHIACIMIRVLLMGEVNLWTGNSIGVVLSYQPHIYGFWKFSSDTDQIRISQLCIIIRLLYRGEDDLWFLTVNIIFHS